MLKCSSRLVLLLAGIVGNSMYPHASMAADEWVIRKLDRNSVPAEIVIDTRIPAKRGIPSGRVAQLDDKSDIRQAWYTKPTTRYAHAILGDNIEAGALRVRTADGGEIEYVLPENQVFEDLTPRLADLDLDGTTEIITIISGANEGGSIAIFGINNDQLRLKAQSPYIGRSNRWLNIAGIGQYKGLKSFEIALVVTPHIGGRLDLYEYSNGKLKRITASQGFSNHEIGSIEQRLSTTYRPKGENRDFLAVPSANRRTLKIMSLKSNKWNVHASISLPSSVDKAIGIEQKGDQVTFTLGLSNGTVISVSNR